MRTFIRGIIFFMFLLGSQLSQAQICFDCGEGLNGKLIFKKDSTLTGGTYEVESFIIQSGVTVNVLGNQPLIIKSRGEVQIYGVLNASGGDGNDGLPGTSGGRGGRGVAGGFDGANGTYQLSGLVSGQKGYGTGAGLAGQQWSGGSGAGHAHIGYSAGNFNIAGGNSYGDIKLTTPFGGSGGGSGAGGNACGSGGGGAGGGVVVIHSCESIIIGNHGAIMCNGGNGGSDAMASCGGGGGGSGGSIWLACRFLKLEGLIAAAEGMGGKSAVNGSGTFGYGGNGSVGRIRLDYKTAELNGLVYPANGYNSNPFIAQIFRTLDAICNASANGYAKVRASGGTEPYQFLWSNGSTDAEQKTLHAGSYTVTVSDASGCSQKEFVHISEPPPLQYWTQSIPPTCSGQRDAYAAGNAIGGTPFPVNRRLATASLLYTNQKMHGVMFTVSCDQELMLNAFAMGLLGTTTDTVLIWHKEGSYTGFEHQPSSWDKVDEVAVNPLKKQFTSIPISNPLYLQKGFHSFYIFSRNLEIQGITDEAMGSAKILQQGLTLFSGICRDSSYYPYKAKIINQGYFCGRIDYVSINSNGKLYDYSWNNKPDIDELKLASAGVHQFQIKDANGCITEVAVTIPDANKVLNEPVVKAPACHGGMDGQIVLAPNILPNTQSSYHTLISNTSVQGLMMDFETTVKTTLKSISIPVTDTSQISVYLCNGSISGKETDAQQWYSLGQYAAVPSIPGALIQLDIPDTTLSQGIHGLYLFDANGTIGVSNPVTNQTANQLLHYRNGIVRYDSAGVFATTAIDSAAFSGMLKFEAADQWIQYDWSNGSSGSILLNAVSGNYSVHVADASGCKQDLTISVKEPDELNVISQLSPSTDSLSNGSISVSANGGNPPYYFYWPTTGTSGSTLNDLSAGSYPIFLVDANGCTYYDTLELKRISTAIPAKGILVVGPNPSKDYVHITKDIIDMNECLFQLFDDQGREVMRRETSISDLQVTGLHLRNLRDGLYWFTVSDASQRYSTRFTLIR